eukprot:3165798-Pleurochrysis_carterae.AAC.2
MTTSCASISSPNRSYSSDPDDPTTAQLFAPSTGSCSSVRTESRLSMFKSAALRQLVVKLRKYGSRLHVETRRPPAVRQTHIGASEGMRECWTVRSDVRMPYRDLVGDPAPICATSWSYGSSPCVVCLHAQSAWQYLFAMDWQSSAWTNA